MHAPQPCFIGASGTSSALVTTQARKTYEPSPGTMRQQFLPTNPTPARSAHARSMTGFVSTASRALWPSDSSQRTTLRRRLVSTLW